MRLRDLREDRDLSQHAVAELLHIRQNTYSQYETGRRQIPIALLIQLSEFYETSVDYLLGQEDTPEATEEALENGVASIPLSTQEMELLQLFRRLTPAEQKQSLAQIREKQRTSRHSGDKGINR